MAFSFLTLIFHIITKKAILLEVSIYGFFYQKNRKLRRKRFLSFNLIVVSQLYVNYIIVLLLES